MSTLTKRKAKRERDGRIMAGVCVCVCARSHSFISLLTPTVFVLSFKAKFYGWGYN